MPCNMCDVEIGEKIIAEMELGLECDECGHEITPAGEQTVAVYVGFNEVGQHTVITDNLLTCPNCGGESKELALNCGNTARGLFSLIGYQEPEASTEAESLVVIEAPRRSTYTPPKNSVTLWE